MGTYYRKKKPFHDRSYKNRIILDILEGKRPEVTEDTPEFYADLMKKHWEKIDLYCSGNQWMLREISLSSLWIWRRGNP